MINRYVDMKKYFLKIGLLCFVFISFAYTVSAQAFVKNEAFKAGEHVTYDAYYNWGFIWMQAARVHFVVRDASFNKRPAYHFLIAGNTLNTFDAFYTVKDTLMSYANKNTLQPFYYKRIAHEDSYWAEDDFIFDEVSNASTKVRTICLRRKKAPQRDTLRFNGVVTDLVTSFYRLRNYNFAELKPNEKVPFSIVYDNDGKKFDLFLRYLGKETVTLKNGEIYRCLKFRPLLIKGKVFRDENGMTVWISDDENHIPVLIEAKLRVGSVKAMMIDVRNTLHPLSSHLGKKK